MNEQNNPLIVKGTEHTEEFDHREQDGLQVEIVSILLSNPDEPAYEKSLKILAKAKQRYEAQIIALQEIIQYLEQKGGKMKTIEEIKERIDFVEQVKYDVGFDQDVHGVEVDMSEIQQSNGYIKALKWVINDK